MRKALYVYEKDGTEILVAPREVTINFLARHIHVAVVKIAKGLPETVGGLNISMSNIDASAPADELIRDAIWKNRGIITNDGRAPHPYELLPEWRPVD